MSDTVPIKVRSLVIVALVASLTAVGVRRCGRARLDWQDVDWTTIESFALRVDLTRPGRIHAEGDLVLTGVTTPRVSFLLNRELEVGDATIDGKSVAVRHGARLRSRYFSEGRVVEVELSAVPPTGRVSLHLAYGGEAARGREGPDWRGILFVDADEARMCEQTLFFPAVPMSTRGPNLHEARYALEVDAPAAWEVFVPAPGGPSESENAVRRWHFASERPGLPSILGGLRERTDAEVRGLRFVTLLREEHAALAPEFVAQATRALEDFAERFGAIDAGVVGVIEITCRDSSYNWTAEGVIAFDRGALSGSVPTEKLAHEVAHLWWGQAVDAAGDGERFLTEGLAEYSAWSHLRREGRGVDLARSVRSAREKVAKLARQGDSLPMAEVAFGVEHYSTLAYDKGALVLWALGAQLAPGQLDAALQEYASRGAKRETSLDDLRASLRSITGREDLRVPWLDGAGDLELALADVHADSGAGRVALEIRARRVPAGAAIDPRGAPVAVALGGRGWSERHVVWLEGESTRVELDTRGRPLAYVQLDPEAGWTLPVVDGVLVLDGASLVASTPSAGRAAEFGGTRVVLRFDRALSPISAEELQASWSDPGEERVHLLTLARAVLSSDATELILTTGPWYPDRRYRIPLGALRDADGLPVQTRSLEFAVAPSGDTQAPEVVATVPEVGAEVAAPGGRLAVSMTFDEPMRSGRAITNQGVRDVRARGFSYPKIDGFGSWDASGRILTYHLVELEAGTTYALPIRARGFLDLSGNQCRDFDLVFTVTDTR